jgi:hypothetical protein
MSSTSSRRSGVRMSARPENHVTVLSWATGDLACRTPLPGLFHLASPRRWSRRWSGAGQGIGGPPGRRPGASGDGS